MDVQSADYALNVLCNAATWLQAEINTLLDKTHPKIKFSNKIDKNGGVSPVTKYDKIIERYISQRYSNSGVRVLGEENTDKTVSSSTKPENTIDLHVDPIDGTELFISHVQNLIEWAANKSEPYPSCGSMISAGAVNQYDVHSPKWGVVVSPFIVPGKIVAWTSDICPSRIENGILHKLPQTNNRLKPKTGDIIMVSSGTSEKLFGDALRAHGYQVIKYKSAVAAALCMIDKTLLHRLVPKSSGRVIGVVMRRAKDWDTAATTAMAQKLGYFVGDRHGLRRPFNGTTDGAIFAATNNIGEDLAKIIAPYADKV